MPRIRASDPDAERKAEFREWIKGRMAYHGMNCRELAKRTGISERTISEHIRHPEKVRKGEEWMLIRILGKGENDVSI